MNLFIDANIFLDFYHFSNDDLDELKKLIDLINKGEITLVITTQIIDEVKRNRDNKVSDAYKKFQDSKIDINLPQICKSYDEFAKIRDLSKTFRELKNNLDEKLKNDIDKRTLKADEVINELFGISQLIDSEKYYNEAKARYELGNPPGKQGSYGDSVNWVTLLSELDNKQDLFFISDDKDFKSPLDELLLNSFLIEEWEVKKKSKIYFYTKLSDFFGEHHKDIQLKVEEDKNNLILKLRNSPNFVSSHAIVWKLSKYVSFTDEQIRELVSIAVNNSQVYSILSDSDISVFYSKLLENKSTIIDSNEYSSLMSKILEEEFESTEIEPPF